MFARTRWLLNALLVLLFSVPVAGAQSSAQGPGRPLFAQHELDRMLAPIALYPDTLLAQILMASTYPREVVEAARWSRRNPGLNGDRAVRAAAQADWDPSVKSLVAFPQILDMMDEKLAWTEDLGDAFLDQEAQVMDTVQYLRRKAHSAGNLSSSDQFRVDFEESSFTINFANPEVAYLPYYNPTIVFGTWWWPAHQPVYWAPWPGYYSRAGYARGYAWGPGIPVARGFFFGAPDWRQRHVKIVNVNNYYYRPAHVSHPAEASRIAVPGAAHVWQHDTVHRRDAPYRDATARHHAVNAGAAPDARRDRDTSPGNGRGAAGNSPATAVAAQAEVRSPPHQPHALAAADNAPRGPTSRGHERPAPEVRAVAVGTPAPAVAAQPATRSVPVQPDTAVGTPQGVPGRGAAAREHDRSAFEGRGDRGVGQRPEAGMGHRSEARVEPASRQAQPVVAVAQARPLPERAPAPAPLPAVAREPAPRTATASASPNAQPAVSAAAAPDGAGRRAEARPASGRDRANSAATEPADGRKPRHP